MRSFLRAALLERAFGFHWTHIFNGLTKAFSLFNLCGLERVASRNAITWSLNWNPSHSPRHQLFLGLTLHKPHSFQCLALNCCARRKFHYLSGYFQRYTKYIKVVRMWRKRGNIKMIFSALSFFRGKKSEFKLPGGMCDCILEQNHLLLCMV